MIMEYDQKTISESIHTEWAGKTVHFAKETDSTNEWIKKLSKEKGDWEEAGRHRKAVL